jgi:DNA-binding MarR family transcriptional regulator
LKKDPSSRKPLQVKLDYFTFRMDVVGERAKEVASTVYERAVGLSLRELRLMRFIATQPGLTLTRLIEQTHIEKTLTSKAITQLVQRGLVLRAIGEADARQINLYLTGEGAVLVKKADVIGQNMEAVMMRRIPEADVAVFRRCLEMLDEASDEMSGMTENFLKPARQEAPPEQRPTKRAR